MNFYDAHEPFEPPPPFRERFAGGFRHSHVQHRHNLLRGVNARRLDKWAMSDADVAGELAMYEASIASIDFEIGAILDALEERALLDSTLVILTADHGEQM